MPFPVDDQRHVVTTLQPRTARKNPYGNGQPYWMVFDWPGPAKASESNHTRLPFDFRVELVQITYTSGTGWVPVQIHGLDHPALEGPHIGEVYVPAPDDAEVLDGGTRVWAEILYDDESLEGVNVVVYGFRVD